ncbi:MAG: YHS domain-containing protein [Myxococcota bacterium]|nr:YHS domain-containing protein [Myxococcota bacterium]
MKLYTLTGLFLATFLALGSAAACDKETKEHAMSAALELAAPMAFDKPPAVGTKAKCPVMGQEFTVKENSEFSTHKGKTYVFCCPGCKPKFDKNPEKYLNQ